MEATKEPSTTLATDASTERFAAVGEDIGSSLPVEHKEQGESANDDLPVAHQPHGSDAEDTVPADHRPSERLPAKNPHPPARMSVNGDTAADDLPDEHNPSDARPGRRRTPKAPIQATPVNAAQVKWEAVFAPEGSPTDDGRMFWPGAISWRNLPLSLMAMTETQDGHDGAQVAGRIDDIWRDNNVIRASGVFDDSEFGREIARMVSEGILTGLSVDIAAREYEMLSRGQLYDAEGKLRADALERDPEADGEPDLIDILFGGDDVMFVVTDGVIGAATVCPFPAFSEATIGLTASGMVWRLTLNGGFRLWLEKPVTATDEPETITAGAAGLASLDAPPRDWFDDPGLGEATPLTVTDDGQIFGHAALWDICHIGIPDVCTTAPRTETSYAYFHLGEVDTDDGGTVSTGRITLGTTHADRRLARQAATEHYDHSGWAVADVRAGEDAHGIWIAGALRPNTPAEKIRELRASGGVSGDWRNVNGNLELVALLAVNVPGFPIPRAPRALVAGGQLLTLLSAGMFDERLYEVLDDDRAKLAALSARARGGLDALAALARGAE